MPLTLTPEMLEKAYAFLSTTKPFSVWSLPFAEEVEFAVIRNTEYLGFFSSKTVRGIAEVPVIEISDRCCGHTDTLLRAMAHEMLHAHQWYVRKDNRAKHNADFRRKAKRVCDAHGWDPKLFV